MPNERQLKHLWISLIVSISLGFIFLIYFSIKYYEYKNFSKKEKENLRQTFLQMIDTNKIQKEGHQFIKKILPQILKDWSLEAYLLFIEKENFSEKELGILPFYMQKNKEIYGAFVKNISSQGNITLKGSSIKDVVIYGEYKFISMFEKKSNPVEFTVSIIKNSTKNKWFLESFHDL